MSVSRWERGAQEPSSEILIMLGNLTASPDNWYFWQTAGLSRKAIAELRRHARTKEDLVVPSFSGSLGKAAKRSALVPIPLLNVAVGARTSSVPTLSGEVEAVLAAPRAWCPNPAQTVCLHVDGDAMMPVIPTGSIIAVDTTHANVPDLYDKFVIAQHPSAGLLLARLSRNGQDNFLVVENPTYQPIPFSAGCKVSGRVLWWVGFSR